MSIRSYPVRILNQLCGFALAISLAGCVVVFASWSLAGNSNNSDIAETADGHKTVAALEQQQSLVESEIITATRRGFEPATITRPKDKFILMVDNRSGTELSFRLSRETGESLHEIKSSREEPDWNELMNLSPGRYVLSERDHPDWTCSIIITAR